MSLPDESPACGPPWSAPPRPPAPASGDAGTGKAGCATLGSDALGSDALGSDALGSDTLGSDTLRDAVRVLARLNRMLESADAGLTLPQYRVLCALCEGGQRSARLADKLAVRKPTLTALADGLIAAGYALRESEPGDRRIVRLCLTPAGKAALHRADTAYRARLSDLLADVPDPAAFVGGLLAVGGALDNAPDRRAAGKPAADRQTAADTQASDTETAADTQTEDERGTEKAVVHR